MSDEKKEPWLSFLALTTVILAVCATLAGFKGGGYSTRSLLSQTQASDQWAYYQAKSIKGSLCEMNQEKLELELKTLPKSDKTLQQEYQNKIATYEKKIAKYEAEKAQIQAEAKRLESIRDTAKAHGNAFGFAVIFLQIAILLCSIAALLKQKAIWAAGSAVGAVGVLYFLNGFWLFLK